MAARQGMGGEGRGKGRGEMGRGGRSGEGKGGPKESQSSVVGTTAADHVEVLTPKLLSSHLLLRAAMV